MVRALRLALRPSARMHDAIDEAIRSASALRNAPPKRCAIFSPRI